MLSRINEINIIKSYYGTYNRGRRKSALIKDNYFNNHQIRDERAFLQINFKEVQLSKDFKIGKLGHNNISALFYGEIFNYDELINMIEWNQSNKKELSFSTLCCFLYQKYGIYFAKYINGMFSLVLRDEKEDILLLLVDRFGLSKPIYYRLSGDVCFSSHLKRLLRDSNLKKEIDEASLALFLKYSYIPSPRTIIKGIKKLNPGEMIICHKDIYKKERYIDFQTKPTKMSEEEAVHEYTALLTESISSKLETYNNQRVGIFLSGGLDSSANVALAAKLHKCKFETFGIGFNDPKVDERPYARIVARYFGVPFNEYLFDGSEIEDLPKLVWHLEEPFLENGLFLTYAGFKSAQSKADVVISGNCADQLFGTGGFAGGKPIALRYLLEKLHIQSLFSRAKKFTQAPLFYKDNALFKLKVLLDRGLSFNDWFFWGFDDHELKKICKFDIQSSTLDVFPNDLADVPLNLADYYRYSVVHQDIEHYACQNVLVKSNRIAEMFGIYTRDPFLDYKVIDFLLSLELLLKRKGGLFDYFIDNTKSKYLHRLAMENMLPPEILNKPKQGGSINMTLLLDDSNRRKMIFNHILTSNILKEYIAMGYIRKLLDEYEALNNKRIYWQNHCDSIASKILNLLSFSVWHSIIMENTIEDIDIDIKLTEMIS